MFAMFVHEFNVYPVRNAIVFWKRSSEKSEKKAKPHIKLCPSIPVNENSEMSWVAGVNERIIGEIKSSKVFLVTYGPHAAYRYAMRV